MMTVARSNQYAGIRLPLILTREWQYVDIDWKTMRIGSDKRPHS